MSSFPLVDLFCSTKIQTGSSDIVFKMLVDQCVEVNSMMKWKNAYDPAYHTAQKVCAGYVDVNATVACDVKGFNDTGVRRLCRCLHSGLSTPDFNHILIWAFYFD